MYLSIYANFIGNVWVIDRFAVYTALICCCIASLCACVSYSESIGQTVYGFAFYLYFVGCFADFGSSVIGIYSSILLKMLNVGVLVVWVGIK